MKFRVQQSALADGLGWAVRSVSTRPAQPILTGVRLVTSRGEGGRDILTVSGSSPESTSEVDLEVDLADGGEAVIPGRVLAELARSLPDRPVEIVVEGTRVTVSSGHFRSTLPTLPVEDYPSPPTFPQVQGTLPAALFTEAVAQVQVAAGRDDMLPMLTAVRVEVTGDRIVLAATDRYRLAVRELTWSPNDPTVGAVALVPAKPLGDMAKSIGGSTVGLTLEPHLFGVAGDNRRATTRLLDGEFPKFQNLFPTVLPTQARVDTAELVEAVRRVRLVLPPPGRDPITLTFHDGKVELSAGRDADGEATEELPAILTGEPITLGYNPGYLLDGLSALGAPVAVLSFTEPTRPTVLQGAPDTEAEPAAQYRHLLMPMRLPG
jgi:DNA polymerase-3 subunit beta